MNWQTIVVPLTSLIAELARIRRSGGTVTRCCPDGDCCRVTYVSVG
ncbi:hypothetical protein [Nocardioides albidus]|nr:hypothetical protein [Nocardioides albidus]